MPRIWSKITSVALCLNAQRSIFTFPMKLITKHNLLSSTLKLQRQFSGAERINLNRKSVNSTPACWRCGVPVELDKILFCKACEVVQKPDQNTDYFKVFNLKRSFEIDTISLTRKFRLLQMQLHPDRFSQKTETEKLISACYSSLVNQAYRTLLSPIERGLYLLELEGYSIDEGDMTKDPEFFQEILEINEELDNVQNKDTVVSIREKNLQKLNELLRRLSIEFDQFNWESARELLAKIKFYNNIHEKIKNLEHHLENEKI